MLPRYSKYSIIESKIKDAAKDIVNTQLLESKLKDAAEDSKYSIRI